MKKLFFVFLLFSTLLFANIGSVTLLEGEAYLTRNNNTLKLNLGDSIENYDFIETKINSKIKITFLDNTVITIGKESSLNIEDYFFSSNEPNKANAQLNVTKGAFHTITGQIGKVNPSKFKLKTKNASIGIRGTEFYGNQAGVFCTSGAIFVESFGQIREVQSGFFINTFNQQIPSQVMPIDEPQLGEVISQLQTNQLSSNAPLSNDFSNSSNPLSLGDGNIPNIDNQNSWGYWASNISDENNSTQIDNLITNASNINPNGGLTDPSYIQNIIASSSTETLSFNGSFYGNNITDAGYINLNVNIGGGSNFVAGSYNFSYLNNQYQQDLGGGSVFNQNGQMFFEAMNNDTRAIGQFYGSTMDSMKGTLSNFDSSLPNAKANFSASR